MSVIFIFPTSLDTFKIQHHISALWRSEHRFSQDTYIWTAILGWFWGKITHFPGCDNGAVATKRKFHFIVEAHINMRRGEMTGCLMSV